jgi:hypothetical protein
LLLGDKRDDADKKGNLLPVGISERHRDPPAR